MYVEENQLGLHTKQKKINWYMEQMGRLEKVEEVKKKQFLSQDNNGSLVVRKEPSNHTTSINVSA